MGIGFIDVTLQEKLVQFRVEEFFGFEKENQRSLHNFLVGKVSPQKYLFSIVITELQFFSRV